MAETTTAQTSQPTVPVPALSSFQTYGWRSDPSLTDDVNFMDLVLLVTRSSQLLQGGMACILVRPKTTTTTEDLLQVTNNIEDGIVSVATNQSFYKENESDIHAEIVAISASARAGRSTDQCIAYITMPPCKRCLSALYTAGINRIVSRHPTPENIRRAAETRGIDFFDLPIDVREEQRARIDALVQTYYEQEGNSKEGTHDA
jgi:deoxycytidylate deaminase